MELYFTLIIIFGVLWYVLNQYTATLILEYRYHLYALRDQLREKAINKSIEPNNIFYYVDHSISKTIHKLNHYSIIHLYIHWFLYRNDKKLSKFREKIDQELQMSPELKQLYDNFIELVAVFVVQRHPIAFIVSRNGRHLSFILRKKIAAAKKNIRIVVYESLETPDLTLSEKLDSNLSYSVM